MSSNASDADLAAVFAAVVLLAALAPATVPVAGASANDAVNTDTATATAPATATANAGPAPEITAVYPNPATDGDAGEFVAVRFPDRTNASGWWLADGESNVSLPARDVSGRVALATDPAVARNRTDATVLALDGDLSLANGGETIRLGSGDARSGQRVVSTATYEDAPEAERWHRVRGSEGSGDRPDWRWTPLGATDFEVLTTDSTDVRAFVLPDAPGVPVETLREADRRILLAGYTFTSERAADALASAADRGVEVRVLVDGAPVGGVTRREAKLLDSLVARGVEVRVLGGPLARYDFHHPKYAVADDRALVTTENWKPSGTGGHASRGWGAVVDSEAAAGRLADLFRADAGWRGATPWSEFRRGEGFTAADGAPANETYPAEIAPRNVEVSSSNVLIAPDNAEDALLDLLDSADESIRVQQVSVGGRRHSLLRATLRAARRGVEVEVLLSSAWYVEEDNRRLVEWLNRRAESANLSLEARLADPRGRYEKIHAKGVVVDGDAAVVGSLNWNNNSARQNREVAVLLRGEAVGGYYADAFDADWSASAGDGANGNRVPVGLLGAVAVGAIVAILAAKREVVFEK